MLYHLPKRSVNHNYPDCIAVALAYKWIRYACDVYVPPTIMYADMIAGSDINITRAMLGVARPYATATSTVWSAQRQRTTTQISINSIQPEQPGWVGGSKNPSPSRETHSKASVSQFYVVSRFGRYRHKESRLVLR